MEYVRVLQVGLSSYPGGVENAIMNYYRVLDKSRVHMDFVCTEASLAYGDEIEGCGGKIYYLPNPKHHMLRFAKALKKIINDGKYDVVHVNMLSAVNIFPIIFAKGTHAGRIIAHAHNSSLPGGLKKAVHHILKHLIPFFTKEWMACSVGAARWLFGQKRIPKVYILKNAIDYDRFCYNEVTRNEMRARYELPSKTPLVGHVGRFNTEKNHKFLVKIFAEVHQQMPEAKLLLVGDGPLVAEVKAQVEDLGLADSVIFAGGVSDASAYYQMMDVFCMPSTFEGLGIVAIEAQASGLDCVCSTGVPDEAVITDSTKRVSLAEPETWVSSVLSALGHSRKAAEKAQIEQAGYCAATEAMRLENYYLQ